MPIEPQLRDVITKTGLVVFTFVCILIVVRIDFVVWILSYGRATSKDVDPLYLRIFRTIAAFVSIYGACYIAWHFIYK
jgi:hypothetical protein